MNQNKIKYRLARELGNMAESILRREAPFENFPIHLEAANFLYLKLLEYSDEINALLKQKVLEYVIDEAKWYFLDSLIPIKSTFDEQYPQHIQTEILFRKWLKQKERDFSPYKPSYVPMQNIDIIKIIKKVMQQRMPEYYLDAERSRSSVFFFSKSWISNQKVFLIIDMGSARDFLDFLVGVSTPYLKDIEIYHTTVASFYGGIQCVYSYDSSIAAERSVNKAIDLVKAIIPMFLGRIQKAYES
jgi:hypothetical protein